MLFCCSAFLTTRSSREPGEVEPDEPKSGLEVDRSDILLRVVFDVSRVMVVGDVERMFQDVVREKGCRRAYAVNENIHKRDLAPVCR